MRDNVCGLFISGVTGEAFQGSDFGLFILKVSGWEVYLVILRSIGGGLGPVFLLSNVDGRRVDEGSGVESLAAATAA